MLAILLAPALQIFHCCYPFTQCSNCGHSDKIKSCSGLSLKLIGSTFQTIMRAKSRPVTGSNTTWKNDTPLVGLKNNAHKIAISVLYESSLIIHMNET